ncbi:dihydrofolate reductase [Candidatus Saccharibacteria bacterium]|nr:dihydrofolate reductase [Candidatus Saccharibacteria bacterium]
MFALIAVIGKNRELGKDNQLIFEIPEDMRYFREKTMGHKVVMGRKTWESLPGKLDGRENIVVSRGGVSGADKVVRGLGDFLRENADTEEEILVIGGGMVYAEALPYARRLYLTEVDKEMPEADAYFPEFDSEQYNREIVGEGAEGDLSYKFVKYNKKEV